MKIRMSKTVCYPDPGGPHLPMFHFFEGEIVDVFDRLGEIILRNKHGILVVENAKENKIVEPTSKDEGVNVELKDDIAPSVYDELKPKQKKFVNEYLVDFDVTQAMVRAGYKESSAKSRGAEFIKDEVILAALAERSR